MKISLFTSLEKVSKAISNKTALNMKIRANDIDLIDAKRFDSFSSIIINCKNKIAALIKS